jgi:hypothetical protein
MLIILGDLEIKRLRSLSYLAQKYFIIFGTTIILLEATTYLYVECMWFSRRKFEE